VAGPGLILASTSRYRRALLDRFGLTYRVEAPRVDEDPLPGERPEEMASRLAMAKADAVARLHPQDWVIGSDQVAERDGLALGKPGDHAGAVEQLRSASGKAVRFHTAVCLRRVASDTTICHRDLTEVRFLSLDAATIERYLQAERPYDCAGSFKSEGLGICLFEAIDNHDPTALIGLPMIALAKMLRQAGFALP
jgi:septum formation protein